MCRLISSGRQVSSKTGNVAVYSDTLSILSDSTVSMAEESWSLWYSVKRVETSTMWSLWLPWVGLQDSQRTLGREQVGMGQ